MRISDWSSDVCSSDLQLRVHMAAICHPIVGDGKYGGKGAFLTGAISRKMHLHSRRLRIDHPDGGAIDNSAELPEHFAASIDALGFDLLRSEEPTSELPSIMRHSYALLRLKPNKKDKHN